MAMVAVVKGNVLEVTPCSLTATLAITGAVPVVAIRLAGTWALSCVELTKVVLRADPFQFTAAPEMKLLPFTVSVNAGPLAVVAPGLSEIIAGGGVILKMAGGRLEVAPCSLTVMLAVPALAIRLAGTWALSWVALTKVVVTADPFQFTVAPEMKLLPFTVSVNVGPVAVIPIGLSELTTGCGLMVKGTVLDVAPAPLTVMLAVRGTELVVAIRLAGTWALSCVEFTNVVVRAAPFQFTAAPKVKLLPVTVRVNAGPLAVVLPGFSEIMAGGALIVRVYDPDAAGSPLESVTDTVTG